MPPRTERLPWKGETMMTRKIRFAILVLLCGLLLAPAAFAGGGAVDESIATFMAQTDGEPMRVAGTPEPAATQPRAATSDSWKFEITPYLWAIGVDGNFVVEGLDVDVDADFSDIVSNLDMALCLRGEAWHGPLGFTLDIMYLRLSQDVEPLAPLVSVDLGLDMLLAEAAVTYRFDWPLTGVPGDKRLLTIEPIVGLRYVGLESDIGPIGLPGPSDKEDWLEPFVGFRTTVQITDRLTAGGGVNFGGFSIGSRLTWVAFLGVDYRFSELLSVKLGYKYMDIDYSTGSGDNRFVVDTALKGLWLGVSLHF